LKPSSVILSVAPVRAILHLLRERRPYRLSAPLQADTPPILELERRRCNRQIRDVLSRHGPTSRRSPLKIRGPYRCRNRHFPFHAPFRPAYRFMWRGFLSPRRISWLLGRGFTSLRCPGGNAHNPTRLIMCRFRNPVGAACTSDRKRPLQAG
jgi:hypothetical protein